MARYNGTAWDNNTSIGYNNLPNMTSGSGNTSVGAESMMSLVTGQENTSIGNQSLISVTGNSNVGVGKRSGQTITSGSQNRILGTDADVSSAILNNATAIGYGAQVTASNAIQLGNSSVTNVKTSGSITAVNNCGNNGRWWIICHRNISRFRSEVHDSRVVVAEINNGSEGCDFLAFTRVIGL